VPSSGVADRARVPLRPSARAWAVAFSGIDEAEKGPKSSERWSSLEKARGGKSHADEAVIAVKPADDPFLAISKRLGKLSRLRRHRNILSETSPNRKIFLKNHLGCDRSFVIGIVPQPAITRAARAIAKLSRMFRHLRSFQLNLAIANRDRRRPLPVLSKSRKSEVSRHQTDRISPARSPDERRKVVWAGSRISDTQPLRGAVWGAVEVELVIKGDHRERTAVPAAAAGRTAVQFACSSARSHIACSERVWWSPLCRDCRRTGCTEREKSRLRPTLAA
jgi:hypothetical protein